jgi:hypothetical protein
MDKNFSDIINTLKRLDEAAESANPQNMRSAEHNPRGAKFSGYWKGTDKNPPEPGMGVGGCEESIEETIAREWNEFIREAGATNNPQQGGTQQNPQVAAKQQQTLSTSIQKLSQASGKKPPGGVPTAAKGAGEVLNNPNANLATGQNMSPNAKKAVGSITDEILPAIADPQAAQQISTAVKNATQKQNIAKGAA